MGLLSWLKGEEKVLVRDFLAEAHSVRDSALHWLSGLETDLEQSSSLFESARENAESRLKGLKLQAADEGAVIEASIQGIAKNNVTTANVNALLATTTNGDAAT